MRNWNQTTQNTPVLGQPSLGDASPGLPVWGEQDRALYLSVIKVRPLFLCQCTCSVEGRSHGVGGLVEPISGATCVCSGQTVSMRLLACVPSAERLHSVVPVCPAADSMQSLTRAQVKVPLCNYSLCAGADCAYVGSCLNTGASVPALAWVQVRVQVQVMSLCHLAFPSLAIWAGVLRKEQSPSVIQLPVLIFVCCLLRY